MILPEITRSAAARSPHRTVGTRSMLRSLRRAASTTSPSGWSLTFTKSAEYCRDLVAKNDHDHYLASLFLPANLRPYSWALRAFNYELATIRDNARDDTLGRIRFQFWRETVEKIYQGNPPEQPIAIVLAAAMHEGGLSAHRLKRIINGREENFLTRQYPSLDALEEYAESTASALLYLHLELLGVKNLEIDHIASHIGKAQGIATLLRGTPFHLRSRHFYLPSDVCAKHSVVTEKVMREGPSEEISAAVFEIATRANDHLITARSHMKSGVVTKDAFPALMPAIPTARWLQRLEKHDFNLFDSRVHQRDALLPLSLWISKYMRKF
ncbi:NADH dehydrogenase (ubiquinone) complex I, assembly factor 6 [Allomyces arbusculus]|nr:NADH dehydrogenase (ubiquinone) complex I, assembly factor 6 [Allomyces arbusculus]